MNGICRICGEEADGELFASWVRPTFTDYDKLQAGDIICHRCRFLFEEQSELLAQRVRKGKPQRMRNYSHFVVNGRWIPLSKGDKGRMKELLLGEPFPELACVAESGQKHLLFRATWNPPGASQGYVQFEEHQVGVLPTALSIVIDRIERLYTTFNKTEIQSGNYSQYRVLKFGLAEWQELEKLIRLIRHSITFRLALFLAQKGELDDGTTRESGGVVADNLAGSAAGLQAEVPEHLGTVREQHQERGLHQQSGQVHQLAMFEDEC